MNFEQEKSMALNHACVSSKLKILIKLFDREEPKDAVNDLRYAVSLFKKKSNEEKLRGE